ncbi:heavy metal translocating P-type ATPase [Staphylococcus chromogenes]|uniref:heavy metal translocating P-type ATPase n=1 Tax=Staphylococcus chromogenes TaxID=46126 RepID=UPI0028849977|nr:cation-translocating P-type ATPase [Staphylococcus chromogenes]MDT0735276.1 cation-translocating P-type ATPase [Staphylococcus chromogenes]MDT0749801.1 cation-translocating P-type ATPase [Staphylococcus chromogenes]
MKRFIYQHVNFITGMTFLFLVTGFIFKWLSMTNLSQIFLIISTLIAMVPITLKAYQSVRAKIFSIELLVTIAVIGALWIQEYTESSIVTFLFLFGSYLEARTLKITRKSISDLVDAAPKEAIRIKENGETEKIDVDDVEVGNRIVVRSGSTIPVDGRIVKGNANIIESSITGESVPVSKSVDEKVYSSTNVDTGYLEIIAEKVAEDTTFSKIIELVEEAQDKKSPAEKFLDRFSKWYTPSIALISFLVWLISRDLHLAITFLVIACPGALVIGAPVANVAGIENGAKNGVIIKGGDVIDTFSKVNTLVFDKTGTLTKGHPEVTTFEFDTAEFDENEILSKVAQLEKMSEHHLGRAIVDYAESKTVLPNKEVRLMETVKGQGLIGKVQNNEVIIGNRKIMNKQNIFMSDTILDRISLQESTGNTVVLIAIDQKFIGYIAIADKVRSDALHSLNQMRQSGVKEIIMLTGDNVRTAEAVSTQLKLDGYKAELLPEDKVNMIQLLRSQGKIVAMAGDGINDAPAIATAHIGLAMGKGGTDISMETADLVLMNDALSQYAHAFDLSKKTMSILKQNIAIALMTVVLLLIGILLGGVNLAIGMFVHEVSVLIVILNAMRLIRFRPHHPQYKETYRNTAQAVV